MKRKVRAIIAAALAGVMCAALAGCGRSEADPLANASGTASKVTSKVKIDPDKEQISPFDDLQVTFTGIVPNSEVKISGGNSKITYTANKTSGVKNGDEIEVTAELASPSMEERYQLLETSKTYTVSGLSAYAMKLAEIPEDSLNKIRSQAEDVINARVCGSSMHKADTTAVDSYSFEQESLDFIGYYFLSGKPGFKVSTYNRLFCVYKMKYSVTAYEYEAGREGSPRKTEEHFTDSQEFYTLCVIDNIMLLEDGTCSFDLSSLGITSDWVALDARFCNYYGYKIGGGAAYSWHGYPDIDTMFNAAVTSQIANYDYENTVKE